VGVGCNSGIEINLKYKIVNPKTIVFLMKRDKIVIIIVDEENIIK
jgi:hypothetical protein